jgi:hypothetical protein
MPLERCLLHQAIESVLVLSSWMKTCQDNGEDESLRCVVGFCV